MNGESLYTTGRLLGHRNPATTNRYAHLDDATLGEAAERVAAAVRHKLAAAARRRPGRHHAEDFAILARLASRNPAPGTVTSK